ncbi:MAG: glycogen debranching protein, partial [Sphingobacteriaceae bacterium]
MYHFKTKYICCFFMFCLLVSNQQIQAQTGKTQFINEAGISLKHYGNDRKWYLDNIPFFECSDPVLEKVYYYRWQLYKAHLKNLGENGYIVTEFLNTMGWDLKPFNSLNDATGFHIYEGRWLKNQRYMQDYINFMYKKGGNDRHFSEGIADAAYAYYLVNPDKQFITSQLPSMIKIYNAWHDHFDQAKKLYYIEPLLDATEYTISSIDASGGRDGFRGGDSFRPSINSYMYANALAIKSIASLNNELQTADDYQQKAADIKKEMQQSLWNDSLKHFIDRYKVSNKNVSYWNYIRGRELVGFVPWTYNLPDDNAQFNTAWQHLKDSTSFKGTYGLRTNEPSYQYYMKQYRYIKETGERECQWNGPSWPFQTSQVLLALANLLNNYHQNTVSVPDYLAVLKQYAQQHDQAGKLNIVEDYDPDKGGPIVNLNQRSEHYNHSEFNDLIITGFCGLRPGSDRTLTINPLIAANSKLNSIKYFCLQNVLYHGHNLTVLYDQDGKKYHQGKGLFVYVDGKKQGGSAALGKQTITLPDAVFTPVKSATNLAVNSMGKGFPKSSASYTDSATNT